MKKYIRTFLPLDFAITDWSSIAFFYQKLLARELSSVDALKQFLADWSELEGVLEEDEGWRYIHTTCHTTDPTAKERYEYYITDIEPHIAPIKDQLQKKVLSAKDLPILRQEAAFDILCRKMDNHLRCYREENISIQTDIQLQKQKFGIISSAMLVTIEGQELTLQQAAAHLEAIDRPFRKQVYDAIQARKLQDKDVLNALYTKLIHQRHQLALNAGFKNFRDYSFVAMHRFDYTPQDCFTFHAAIKEEIIPFLNEIAADRKAKLGLPILQPFDHATDIAGRKPLRPFQDSAELVDKTITVLNRLNPFFANCLRTMDQMGHLDLSSRKNKAPGGYNYPLNETGVPFIFMNAASTLQDVLTMFHEGGHAVHSFLTHDLFLNDFKHLPSEIAELASMSMELLTMQHWDVFFQNQEDLNRAKKYQFMHVISCLPWIAAIDAFQHWVYENPYHTIEERITHWSDIFSNFSDGITDWTGYEEVKKHLWQTQLHLFEVPFYYIEYAIAQLGAIGIWKNGQVNLEKSLADYLNALRLGHTVSIKNVYQTAGIQFDFSRQHIRSLTQFIRESWNQI